MKVSVVLLMILLTISGTLYANKALSQDISKIKITLRADNADLKQIFLALQQKSGIRFSFGESLVKGNSKPVSVDFKEVSLRDALKQVLSSTNLNYKLVDDFIIIEQKQVPPPSGVIEGIIYDAKTKETLIGAVVIVNGRSYPTDAKGHYKISLIPGTYTLEIRYIGYNTRKINNVSVRESITTSLNILIEPSSTTLNQVTVSARRRINNEITLLNDRKNAAIVSDGISARNIEKTASITTTQALQRVTGVTITDDKYVAIRGLGDRSVVGELNGVRLSSSNPDRSATPFDLVPAALLENITVYKTLTPDRPADASAGIVELKTKSVPDSLTVSFIAQGGTNSSIGIDGKFNAFRNYDLGYFGQNVTKRDISQEFINLGKQYPGGLIELQRLFIESRNSPALTAEANRINRLNQAFDPVLATSYQKATPNQIYTFTIGNRFKIFNGHDLGLIVSANYYNRTEDRYNATLTQYSLYQGVVTGSPAIYSPLHIPNFTTPNATNLGKYLSYSENTGTQTINYGALIGLTYRFNSRNEISAQYLGNRGAEASGSNLSGSYQNSGFDFPVYNTVQSLKQTYRVFNTYNLQGEHKILNKDWSPRLSYNASISKSSQDEPDFRFANLADKRTLRFQDANGVGLGTDSYAFVTGIVHDVVQRGDSAIVEPNGRRFRFLKENNYNAKADLIQPFNILKKKQELKFGFNYLKRTRTFTENVLGLPGTNNGGDNSLLQAANGDLNALVSYNNVGLKNPSGYDEVGAPRVGGFLYQIKKSANNYEGSYQTRAFYGMLDLHLTDKLRLNGGVRFESTNIQANVDTVNVQGTTNTANASPLKGGNPNTAYKVSFKPYYSANLIYAYKQNMNFRLGYYTSLARPELRELTNIFEYDPFQFAVIGGNPNLKNQFTRSADFRWEWFPKPDEVIAFSLFGKQIYNQLTKVFSYSARGNLTQSPESPVVRFVNDPNKGEVFGIELEARKSLGAVWYPLKSFFIGTNLLLAQSSITKNPERLNAARTVFRDSPEKTRIFEQAPYSVNAYIDYDDIKSGTNATLSFNVTGERLVQVQLDGTPDLYDRPAPQLDFVFSKKLKKRFIVKGFAKNLLNPSFETVYTDPGNGGVFYGTRYVQHAYKRGMEFSLGLTFILF